MVLWRISHWSLPNNHREVGCDTFANCGQPRSLGRVSLFIWPVRARLAAKQGKALKKNSKHPWYEIPFLSATVWPPRGAAAHGDRWPPVRSSRPLPNTTTSTRTIIISLLSRLRLPRLGRQARHQLLSFSHCFCCHWKSLQVCVEGEAIMAFFTITATAASSSAILLSSGSVSLLGLCRPRSSFILEPINQ